MCPGVEFNGRVIARNAEWRSSEIRHGLSLAIRIRPYAAADFSSAPA
jgi:hypothetical protein